MYRIAMRPNLQDDELDIGDLYPSRTDAHAKAEEIVPLGVQYRIYKVPQHVHTSRRPNQEFKESHP